MPAGCKPDAGQMPARCKPDAGQIQARCRPDATEMQARCRPDAGQMRARCKPNASQVQAKQKDVCDICLHYDNKVMPKYRPLINEVRASIAELYPEYFAALDKERQLVAECLDNQANPEYVAALKDFADKHCDRRSG